MQVDLTNAVWTKSSFSNDGGNCVEWAEVSAPAHPKARHGKVVALRDSTNPGGAALIFSHSEIKALVLGAKAGELDHLV